MRIIFTFLLFAFLGTALNAQNVHRCNTVEHIHHIEQQHPGYQAAIDAAFDEALAHSKIARANRSSRDTQLYRIPVVFHVIWNDSSQVVDEEHILDQMLVLNQDYRKTNPEIPGLRAEFAPLAADTRIEFYLANIDPDGNPSNGITYTQSNQSQFAPLGDGMKRDNQGGKDCWPTDRYLNVWVCDMSGGVLGYAYPPTGAPNWGGNSFADSIYQGVALHTDYCNGRNTRNFAGFIGRTLTHEVGHFLGLRHYWGDGGCNQDDGFDDTPRAASNGNFACDLTQNTCNDGAGDLPDMVENYMNYSDDDCYALFTNDQNDLMRSMIELYRSDLTIPLLEAPIVVADTSRAKMDASHVVFALSNDILDEAGAITQIVSGPSNGSITALADEFFGYQPNAGFVGIDEVEYEVCYFDYPEICGTGTAVMIMEEATSITEGLQLTSLKVFPNPSNAVFNVTMEGKDFIAYEVIDAQGALIERGIFTQEGGSIDLSGEANGTYQLILHNESGAQMQSIVLQR